jgi:hypothetical protein
VQALKHESKKDSEVEYVVALNADSNEEQDADSSLLKAPTHVVYGARGRVYAHLVVCLPEVMEETESVGTLGAYSDARPSVSRTSRGRRLEEKVEVWTPTLAHYTGYTEHEIPSGGGRNLGVHAVSLSLPSPVSHRVPLDPRFCFISFLLSVLTSTSS